MLPNISAVHFQLPFAHLSDQSSFSCFSSTSAALILLIFLQGILALHFKVCRILLPTKKKSMHICLRADKGSNGPSTAFWWCVLLDSVPVLWFCIQQSRWGVSLDRFLTAFPSSPRTVLFVLSSPPTHTRCASALLWKSPPDAAAQLTSALTTVFMESSKGKMLPPANSDVLRASKNTCYILECDIKNKIKCLKYTQSVQDAQTSEQRQVIFFPGCCFHGLVQKTSKQ